MREFLNGDRWTMPETAIRARCAVAVSLRRTPNFEIMSLQNIALAEAGPMAAANRASPGQRAVIPSWTRHRRGGALHLCLAYPASPHHMNHRYLVSPSEYDDIGAVLREFGRGFEYDSCEWANLCDWTFLRNYEVIYLNCAQVFEQADYRARLAPALREFVDRGGTLYASDLALTVVCEAFPGRLGIDLGGEEGDFACVVNDRGLKEFLGNEMSVHFDMPAWAMLQELHHDVRVFIEARDLRRTNPREL